MARSAVVARREPTPGSSEESLKDALQQTLDEARMVLPGVQALFGFQLIAVFNDGFERSLSRIEQNLHLAAIVLVTITIALMMTPAAYHRQVDRRRVTGELLTMASRLVSGAMLPLAAASCSRAESAEGRRFDTGRCAARKPDLERPQSARTLGY